MKNLHYISRQQFASVMGAGVVSSKISAKKIDTYSVSAAEYPQNIVVPFLFVSALPNWILVQRC